MQCKLCWGSFWSKVATISSLLNQLHTVAYINKSNHYVLDEIEEHDGVAGAAARGDFGVSEPNQELLEANCTDLEPDIEADVSSRNCSNVPWSASTQGEPSNFSVSNYCA